MTSYFEPAFKSATRSWDWQVLLGQHCNKCACSDPSFHSLSSCTMPLYWQAFSDKPTRKALAFISIAIIFYKMPSRFWWHMTTEHPLLAKACTQHRITRSYQAKTTWIVIQVVQLFRLFLLIVGNLLCLVMLCLISARRDKVCPLYRVFQTWKMATKTIWVSGECFHDPSIFFLSQNDQFLTEKIKKQVHLFLLVDFFVVSLVRVSCITL